MPVRVRDLAERFFAFMEGRNAPGTIWYYRLHLLRFIEATNNIEVGDLRKHHLLEWGKTWQAMQAVKRLFEWAHAEMELIERNPFKTVKLPKVGNRRRVLSRRETVSLLRGSDKDFRRVLIALRESIARPQEIRQVTWESIRWDGDHAGPLEAIAAGDAYFELLEYKSRKQRNDPEAPRAIFINARLGRLLRRLAGGLISVQGPIFFNAWAMPWTSNAIRLRMRRLCTRLGIVADLRGESVVAYSMRHTSATNFIAKGGREKILAEIMGHTSTRTTQRYVHLSRQHLRDALNKFTKDQRT